jgi:spore coat polysaccharide biosynthesis protein SpsF
MPKVGIITQARMTSTRLPGKVMLKAGGFTMLEHHLSRLSWSNVPVFIATTTNNTDQPIADFAASKNIACFRGDEFNVLERFYLCATQAGLDVIIRVTSDCPLIDGNLIGDGLGEYLGFNNNRVYYSNTLERTFPRGLDFEIFSMELLTEAFRNAREQSEKEHVTPYINKNKSGDIVIQHYTSEEDHSNLRWTVDTEDDWRLISLMIDKYKAATLSYDEILAIVLANPELQEINNYIKQKEI